MQKVPYVYSIADVRSATYRSAIPTYRGFDDGPAGMNILVPLVNGVVPSVNEFYELCKIKEIEEDVHRIMKERGVMDILVKG